MKKLLMGSGVLLALLGTAACERTKTAENESDGNDKRVVKRDSVATEYEVTETVVEYDTTKRVKKVEADVDRDADAEVRKDRD